MKYIDKFLKKLNTNRNTFATYILTLISIYIVIDRIVEMLIMIFTGVSYSYWGPIKYTLALACPIFAFLFSGASDFASSKFQKHTLFYLYVISLYIIALSMITQWLNMGVWLLLTSVPNYVELITDFSELVGPAMRAISLYLPLVTALPFFFNLYFGVNDSLDQLRSIEDYGGIDLSDKSKGHGPYTNDIYMCTDDENGNKITFNENSRYQSLFVCGGSGTGKTALIFEPMIAKDIERKSFFREASKELAFAALKTKISTLNAPYDNNYLNKNFNLNMLTPVEGKETIFNAFINKMSLGKLNGNTIYKDLGITVVSPDHEISDNMISICKNFQFSYNIIDPANSESIGLNPFIYDDPSKIAITISSALKAMYNNVHLESTEAYREDLAIHAVENLSILLKEMYPKMNEGMLPNMEDLLKMLTNFDLVEKMCEIMAHDEQLKEKYSIQLAYFKKHFYKSGNAREDTEKHVYSLVTQLDSLLRLPGVKKILCNRYNNINFDQMLAKGELTFVCTRRGELGSASHKAFGLFFLISMQNAVLRRPGNENNRVPNFLYIDEFPDFICKSTEAIFTMYRKYRVATAISAQSLSQLETPELKENYKNTILANCANKIFTGNGVYEELSWWSAEFGKRREWTYSNTMDFKKNEYDSKHGSVKWDWTKYFSEGKLQGSVTQKKAAYKFSDGGKTTVGLGKFNYVDSKYKEPQKVKTYDFSKFLTSDVSSLEDDKTENKKFNFKKIDFKDENDEFNPIQTDNTDSKYTFNNEDAIITNLKKGNPNNY